MKRQIIKSLAALCTGVMTLCAMSSLVVSCDKYDDTEIRNEIAELDKRVQNLESLKTKLEELTSRVDALYTLTFQVSDTNELQYSFDGGKTWIGTGIILASECDCEPCPPCQYVPCDHQCPEVSLIDNGDSVTIKVGDAEFTIEKPEEVVFELRSGKVYFKSETTQSVVIKSSGIDDITVMSYPKGWYAEINSEGLLEVTAPKYEDTIDDGYWNDNWTEYIEIPATAAAEGYVKVHACSSEGKCMVGKLPVIVSRSSLAISAYAGNIYITSTGGWYEAPTYFYGISTKESLEADTKKLFEDLNGDGWTNAYENNNWEYDVVCSFEEVYGTPAEKGVEYVVWALMDDYSQPYSLEDLVIAYYSVVEVDVTENESARTAYNVDINVSVTGVDSYVAVSIPENYCADEAALAEWKAQMVMAMQNGSIYGKKYTSDYSGSAYAIAGGTSYSMTGQEAPDSKVYVLILPIDGRPLVDYTADAVYSFEFATDPLTDGGSVNALAEQATTIMVEEFSYDTWGYVMVEKTLDPYTQLGVKVEPSSDEWHSFYYNWFTAEDYAMYGGDDELLVDALLEGWGMTSENISFPYYPYETVSPKTTMHFVAFFVDKTGKYGQLAKVELTSQELVYSDIAFNEPYATNLTEGVLLNTNKFEFTPETDLTASKFKYVWQQTNYYNPYDGKPDAEMAEEIHFSSSATEVSAADLVDGKLVISGNNYGSSYYVAILPYDETGAPGKSAAIIEYSCSFMLDEVITDEAAFVGEPTITINYPETLMDEGEYGTGSYYGYNYQSYYGLYQFYYEFNYTAVVPEGSTVTAVMVDAGSYPAFLTADAKGKASAVCQGSYGKYYTATFEADFESSYRWVSHKENESAPNYYLAVVWNADGKYYYKEYHCQPEIQKLADQMYAIVHPAE